MSRIFLLFFLLGATVSARAGAPAPWVSSVRVLGPDAQGSWPLDNPGILSEGGFEERDAAREAINLLDTRTSTWMAFIPVFNLLKSKRSFNEEAVAQDVLRLEAHYRTLGYWSVKVTPEVAKPKGSAGSRRALRRRVTFHVAPGPRAMRDGQPFGTVALDAMISEARRGLEAQGYARPSISPNVVIDGEVAAASLNIVTGPLTTLDGLVKLPRKWVDSRAEAQAISATHVGEIYDGRRIARITDRLEKAPGWHDFTAGPIASPPPLEGVQLLVRASREPAWKVRPLVTALGRGATLSAYAGVHATHVPEGPPAQLDLHAEIGGRAFTDPRDPTLANIGPWADLSARVQRSINAVRGWSVVGEVKGTTDLWPYVNELQGAASGGLHWDLTSRFSLEGRLGGGRFQTWHLAGQEERYDPWFTGTPLAPGQPQFLTGYSVGRIDLSALYDTTDRPVLTQRGLRMQLDTTPLGMADGHNFARADLSVRGFVPIIGEHLVGIVRSRAGALDTTDPDGKSLLGERLFLGAIDMRGWARRRVVAPGYAGDAFDLRPGGNLLFFANAELRARVHPDLYLHAFVDAGRVWEGFSDTYNASGRILTSGVHARDLLWEAGGAFTVPTPLGYARLDGLFRINSQPSDRPAGLLIQFWIDEQF